MDVLHHYFSQSWHKSGTWNNVSQHMPWLHWGRQGHALKVGTCKVAHAPSKTPGRQGHAQLPFWSGASQVLDNVSSLIINEVVEGDVELVVECLPVSHAIPPGCPRPGLGNSRVESSCLTLAMGSPRVPEGGQDQRTNPDRYDHQNGQDPMPG